jgi:hypothetical protein
VNNAVCQALFNDALLDDWTLGLLGTELGERRHPPSGRLTMAKKTARPSETVAGPREPAEPHGTATSPEAGRAPALDQLLTSTFRITRRQQLALRRAALELAEESGERPDMSAVVRQALDEWFERHRT